MYIYFVKYDDKLQRSNWIVAASDNVAAFETNISLEVLYLHSTLLPRCVINILLNNVLFRTTPSNSL